MERREILLDCKGVPTQNEVHQKWGTNISEIFFTSLTEDSKILMGTKADLEGPQEELWISPSDQLQTKVTLTIPFTRKYVNALTHGGILELGEDIMLRYEELMRKEKEQAVLDAVTEQKAIAMERLRTMEKRVKRQAYLEFSQEKRLLIKQFNATIKDAVDNTKLQLDNKMKITIQRERRELQELLNDHKKGALRLLEKDLLHRFQVNELEKLNFLNWEYQIFMLEFKQQQEDRLAKAIEEYEFEIERIKREKVCPSCAEVCLTMKLRKEQYEIDKQQILFKYESKITKLKGVIEKLKTRIQHLTLKKIDAEKRTRVWKNNMKRLIKEFQKFINYALNATPGQAEFLLSFKELLAAESRAAAALAERMARRPTAESVAEDILESIICAAMETAAERKKSLESVTSEAEKLTREEVTEIAKTIVQEILERTDEEIKPDIAEEVLENIVCEAIEAATTVQEIKAEIMQRVEKELMVPGTEALTVIFSRVTAAIQRAEMIREATEIVVLEDKAVQIDIDEGREFKDIGTTTHLDASTDTADKGKVAMPTTEAFLEKRVESLLSIFRKHASLTNVFISPGSVHTKYR